MFHFIKGTITHIYATFIVLENNQIGYQIKTPNPFSFHVAEDIMMYTHVYMREDLIDIYGFRTLEEKNLFLKLISVKGIGPKGALAIIANDDTHRLEQAIIASDVAYLQRFPGIGPKASSQIILDLRGKLTSSPGKYEHPKINDIKDALKSLGYNAQELKKLDRYLMDHIDDPIEDLIKMSLKQLF